MNHFVSFYFTILFSFVNYHYIVSLIYPSGYLLTTFTNPSTGDLFMRKVNESQIYFGTSSNDYFYDIPSKTLHEVNGFHFSFFVRAMWISFKART